MARIPYREASELAPEMADIIGTGFNLHKITTHSPGLARASRTVGLFLRRNSTLDARLRELAILQVTYLYKADYEYAHHLKIAAEEFSVPDADLLAIAIETDGGDSGLDTKAKLVLEAARFLIEDPTLPRDKFDALASFLSPEHIVDLLFTIGFYIGQVRLTSTLEIEVEPQYDDYLKRFPIEPPLIV